MKTVKLPENDNRGNIRSLIENDRFIVAILESTGIETEVDARVLTVFNKLTNSWQPVQDLSGYCTDIPFPDWNTELNLLGFYDDFHFGILLTTHTVNRGTKCELGILRASRDFDSFSLVSMHPLLDVQIYAEVFAGFRGPDSPWLLLLAISITPFVECYRIHSDVVIGQSPPSEVSSSYMGHFECIDFRRAICAEYENRLYIVRYGYAEVLGSRHPRPSYVTNEVLIYDLQQQVLTTVQFLGHCPHLCMNISHCGVRSAIAGRFLLFPRRVRRPNMLDMAELRWVNAEHQDDNPDGATVDAPEFTFYDFSLTPHGNLIQSYYMSRGAVFKSFVSIRALSVPTLLELCLRVIHSTVTAEVASYLRDSDIVTVHQLVSTLIGERPWKKHRLRLNRGNSTYSALLPRRPNSMERRLLRRPLSIIRPRSASV